MRFEVIGVEMTDVRLLGMYRTDGTMGLCSLPAATVHDPGAGTQFLLRWDLFSVYS